MTKNDILEIRKQLNLIGVKNLGFIAIEGLDINQKDDLEEIILYTKNKYLLLIKSLKLIRSEYNWEFFRNKFKKYFRLLLNDNKPNSGK